MSQICSAGTGKASRGTVSAVYVDAQTSMLSTAVSRSVRGCSLTTQRRKLSSLAALPCCSLRAVLRPAHTIIEVRLLSTVARPFARRPSLFIASGPLLRLHVGLAPNSPGACTCGTSTAVVPQRLEFYSFHFSCLVHLLDANHERDCQECAFRAHADLPHLLRLLHE